MDVVVWLLNFLTLTVVLTYHLLMLSQLLHLREWFSYDSPN